MSPVALPGTLDGGVSTPLDRGMNVETAPSDEQSVFRGRFEDISLPDIIQMLQITAKSGALVLQTANNEVGAIVFRNGNVVQATSTEGYRTLGERLIETGAVMRGQLQDALRHMARYPGMRVGDALIALSFLTREEVEEEVRRQIAEAVERFLNWTDAVFEFRLGLISLGEGAPCQDVDLVLEKGVEARQLLLEATLIQDLRCRGSQGGTTPPVVRQNAEVSGRKQSPELDGDDEEVGRAIKWFDEKAISQSDEVDLSGRTRSAGAYLSLSEELVLAEGRGETGLLLLRYASELFSDGGLVMCDDAGFTVLGQFGRAFWWGENIPNEPKMRFARGESPLFEMIAADRKPYAGFVAPTPEGGLIAAEAGATEAIAALVIPLLVLGRTSLILFCRKPVSVRTDTRALIALAHQVSVALENSTLRAIAKNAIAARVATGRPAAQERGSGESSIGSIPAAGMRAV